MKDILQPAYQRFRAINRTLRHQIKGYRRSTKIPDYDLTKKDNILFIVIDCLRADHVLERYERKTTPFLSQIAETNTTAISAAPWTFPSVPSLLTGLYPHRHGAGYEDGLRNQDEANPPNAIRIKVDTLPEYLAASDYKTHFFSAVATAELPLRGRFQTQSVHNNQDARSVFDRLLSWWMSNTEHPRFAYVQLADLHVPLTVPKDQPFGEIPDIEGLTHWRFTQSTEPEDEFKLYRRERIRLYDTVLRMVDQELKRLFHRLEATDELEETTVIVTGDHGEEFWDRVQLQRDHFYDPRDIYGVGHGHALTPEVLEVPLFTTDFNWGTESLISTVDIVPTVLSEFGIPDKELSGFDGQVIGSTATDQPRLADEIAYGYDQQAVITDDHHLIHSPHEHETVLLDRSNGNLINDPKTAQSLLQHTTSARQTGTSIEIDEKTKDQLSDLGYR